MIIDKNRPFYSVIQVAQILGISADRLRTYDEDGLVFPFRECKGGKRLYSEFDIEWLSIIRELISKNRMNFYSIKLVLRLVDGFSDKELKNKFSKNLEIFPLVLKLRVNPNYKKFIESE